MEKSIEAVKAKCDEAVENAYTNNPLVMLKADVVYWLIEKIQNANLEIEDWKQSHDKVARALEKSERDHKETMNLLHDASKRQVQRIEVAKLILNLFEVGKKYKITTFDKDFGHTEQKCFVKGKTEESLLLDIYEPFEAKGCWIHWTELDAVEDEGN